MKRLLFLFGLLLFLSVNIQQTSAISVNDDVGISYVASIDLITPVNYVISGNPAPAVVYLGDSYTQLTGFVNSTLVGRLDRNINITTYGITSNIDLRKHGISSNCNIVIDLRKHGTSSNVTSTNANLIRVNYLSDDCKRADLTRLDIGEIANSNIKMG